MIIKNIKDMQRLSDSLRSDEKCISLVPTMGFLHEGHSSLMHLARKHSDFVVTSIYVNPTQFGPQEDFANYPRDIEQDKALAFENGTDALFIPDDNEMYDNLKLTTVRVKKITENLCGASRPWHFDGVTTIVAKLFNIVKPHIAVFGQKDAQQAIVIQQMVKDLNFDIQLFIAPIIREPDGLALSSRNKYLSPSERVDALILNRALIHGENLIKSGIENSADVIIEMRKMISVVDSARIDYISIVDSDTLEPIEKLKGNILMALAVFIGSTRLIDNKLFKI